MELESQLEGLRKRGLGVAALSYDSIDVLGDFATRKGITYPLLSDPESRIIRAFGLMNEIDYPPGDAAYGVPFPGTFVTDARGVVRVKQFEQTYQERRTGASLLVAEGEAAKGSVREIRKDQFTLRTSVSNAEAAPGRRVTLALDFTMAPTMHAYAPGVKGYRPLKLRLAENPLVTLHEVRYPESRAYTFAPLQETVPVFEGQFRVLQDITFMAPSRGAAPITESALSGTLDYQVCSDTICYAPATLPVEWTLTFIPLDRERAPEALRKKPRP